MKTDIPTALTTSEVALLQTLAKDSMVLEIGSLLGYSTVQLAEVALCVYAVDPHDGYPVNDPKPTLESFMSNLKRYGVLNKVVPIIKNGLVVISALRPIFDLAFIDTMGDEEGTYNLIKAVASFLFPKYLAVHDYGRMSPWDCSGVERAVKRFIKERDWYIYGQTDTLVVLTK